MKHIAVTINKRLREGLGSEDIAILDGISLPLIRAHVARLRESGVLRQSLGLPDRQKERSP